MTHALPPAPRYHKWVVSRIRPYLGQNVLDINSGSGEHLVPVLPLVEKLTSIEHSAEKVAFLNRRFKESGNYHAVWADYAQNPPPAWLKVSGFDTILCMNVLAFLEDDLATLRSLNALLPGGKSVLILQVPAHPILRGSLDRQTGNLRRYRKADLAVKLEQTGFKVLHMEYFNRLSALFWWINGQLLKLSLDSRLVNWQIRIYDRLLAPVLKPVEYLFPLPFGQSLLAVAVKHRQR
jgi:2-polyprenyl-3-methyl-5-hydroxy-6-metoxy-1,4-benzoquinol methylase